MRGQLFAGVGLGLLVGTLVALSSSPVVSVVVGSLATGIVTFLGFAGTPKPDPAEHHQRSDVRLGSFGVACTVAVLLGLFVRTHNMFSPSLAEQVSEVTSAGYSRQDALKWVADRNGATLAGDTHAGGTPVATSVLFSSPNSGECQYFDTGKYKDTQEHLNALQLRGGTYAQFAAKISTLDAGERKTVLDSLKLLYCPR